jgi:hypothetical protein
MFTVVTMKNVDTSQGTTIFIANRNSSAIPFPKCDVKQRRGLQKGRFPLHGSQ